jgi:uncharacterized protein YeaO (DUF488 family)
MGVAVKRVYEKPARADGRRVLVDRLWPRGLPKEKAAVHAWLRELAPSDDLRRTLHEDPESWPSFRRRYLKELSRPEAAEALDKLHDLAEGTRQLTLLFASKDERRNNAVVLRDLLDGMRKPPTGTGPGAIGVMGERQRKRMRRPS